MWQSVGIEQHQLFNQNIDQMGLGKYLLTNTDKGLYKIENEMDFLNCCFNHIFASWYSFCCFEIMPFLVLVLIIVE
jgi:hypothetical protein